MMPFSSPTTSSDSESEVTTATVEMVRPGRRPSTLPREATAPQSEDLSKEALAIVSDQEDKLFMKRLAAGDDSALRPLMEKHHRLVYGTCVKMVGDATEAEDLTQTAFIRIYRAAGSYQPSAQFRTWMFTIVRNLVFNELRRRNRVRLDSIHAEDPSSDSRAWDLPDLRTRNPQDTALNKEMMQAIDRAIQALPEQQRLAVILRRYDEMSYEQIAVVLDTTVSATKSLLFRARQVLRQTLQQYLHQS